MKTIVAVLCAFCLSVSATSAQDNAQDDTQEGLDLIEEGTKLIMRQLMEGMGEALADLDQMAEDLSPVMEELRAMIGDLSAYHLPEVLPNGDIIIRRKIPLMVEPPRSDPEAEIDL